MKIMLDTNIFIYAVKSKIDIFSQLKGNELFTTTAVIEELEKLAKNKSKEALCAKTGLLLIKRKSLKVLYTKENADKSLLDYGKKGYAIATHDKVLTKKLKKLGCKTIYIRQKKYLEGL